MEMFTNVNELIDQIILLAITIRLDGTHTQTVGEEINPYKSSDWYSFKIKKPAFNTQVSSSDL
jgi:hypothetical protein